MTAWQIVKHLSKNGRCLIVTLIVFDALVAWAALALVPPTYQMASTAPAVIVNALLITRWSRSQ